MTHLDSAINFIIEFTENVDFVRAYSKMYKKRVPLQSADYSLYCHIQDLLDEYANDNDISEDWYLDFTDIEEIFDKIIDRI